jgi:hypothetical protein
LISTCSFLKQYVVLMDLVAIVGIVNLKAEPLLAKFVAIFKDVLDAEIVSNSVCGADDVTNRRIPDLASIIFQESLFKFNFSKNFNQYLRRDHNFITNKIGKQT